MPGPHISPTLPVNPGRRQGEYHYQYPAQHSPIPPNPYYAQPSYHGQPHASAYIPQWYPPYPQPQQYSHVPHRPYSQPHGPVVVSSHPHLQAAVLNRQFVTTPPIVHSRTPPAQPSIAQTPQLAPSAPSAPAAPPTPSTISQPATSPTPSTPTAPASTATPPPPASARTPVTTHTTPPVVTHRMPYYPALPWLSVPDQPFPPRARRRRRRREAPAPTEVLELPSWKHEEGNVQTDAIEQAGSDAVEHVEERASSVPSTVPAASDLETPATSEVPSDGESAFPTTPSSSSQPRTAGHARTATRPAIPIVPIKPAVPHVPITKSKGTPSATTSAGDKADKADEATGEAPKAGESTEVSTAPDGAPTVASPPSKPPPKSWADLVRSKPSNAAGTTPSVLANGASAANGPMMSMNGTLADVLRSFNVDSGNKISFIEPRGLVNTGNMCYMNSILQVLVFCIPFFDFLDQVGKRAAHSFKSDTPLLDAMIMFLREFKVIDSAESAQKLQLRLKGTELEQYGEAFTPEYVYEVIRRLPRFAHMRRGHQQDAEEFLGFLLAGLHDECVQVMRSSDARQTSAADVTSPTSTTSTDAGWMEVGHKQKSAVTRSSGAIEIESPITKIFGGKLRSELRVPGLKNSVTLEPYQPLQLDIGAPDVHNIIDALKGLTHSETLHGDFNSPRGPGTSATKQVFIETLPPVLILHLKRFQYDNAGGTQKIWKKVGYPLDLEIPKEVFTPQKRSALYARSGTGAAGPTLPRYRLTAVVYHHGKNASGGHYTVDVRRQEGREWIRLDDTLLRRIRSADVAAAGSEEDPRVLAAALELHKAQSREQGAAAAAAAAGKNIYELAAALDGDEEKAEEDGWKEVVSNGAVGGGGAVSSSSSAAASNNATAGKKWSGVVVNGAATPSSSSAGKRTPPKEKTGVKDNKVAYILFYEQVAA